MRLLVGRLLTAAVTAGLVAACSSAEPRSGFNSEVNPAEGTPGSNFGSSGTAPDPNDKGKSCAKAEVEAKKAPVDVILSVDQSGSMSDDITNIKNNINKLSQFLQETGLDYRVIMIAERGTGSFQVCVPPPLGGPSCASNGTQFKSVPYHIESNDTLSIIDSTLNSPLNSTYEWGTFLRKDAVKAFIPITDDDSYLQATEFDTKLLAKPGGLFGTAAARRYVFYPIVGAAAYPGESTCGTNAVNNGKQYLELAKLTKGRWFPICLTDFGPVFQEIAKNVAATVACELPIPKPTDGGKIDLSLVNVSTIPSKGGAAKDIYQDASKACEAGADGWQYNADKTKIVLCGAACENVRNDVGSKVTVQFGCETRVK